MQRERPVIAEAVERDTLGDLTCKMPVFTLIEERAGLLPRVRSSDVTNSIFVDFDLVRDFSKYIHRFSDETFLPAKRCVVACDNSIHPRDVHDRVDDLMAKRLETGAHQLHNRPPIVSVDNKRRQTVGFAVDHTIRVRHRLETHPAAHCALDALGPPGAIDLDIGVALDEAERDLRLRAPERPSKRTVPAIPHQNNTRFRVGPLGNIASVDPGMAALPSPEALCGYSRGVAHSDNLIHALRMLLASGNAQMRPINFSDNLLRFAPFLVGAAAAAFFYRERRERLALERLGAATLESLLDA